MSSNDMQCHICQRSLSNRLPFHCTTCARNALYLPRIQHAELLLEKESIEQEVERNIGSAKSSNNAEHDRKSPADVHPTFAIERTTAERVALEGRIEKILAQAETLRQQVDDIKAHLDNQHAANAQRRLDLKAAKETLAERQSSDFEPVQKSINRIQTHWDLSHAKAAESKLFLCQEAARLYGLQQRKHRKGATGRDAYYIGGLPIPDIRDLNNASPAQVSASATNLAHLVHLTSHYLSLRLPAEITVPHRDYPLPTIFSPGSSYNPRQTPYPGFTPTHSSNNSPSASRIADMGSLPRPRPLHIEKKLAALAKEEPIAYASFVEGITLLAWDIAWMCKTQGMDVGKMSWEEVCPMGKNMWQLLLGPSSMMVKQESSKGLSTLKYPHKGKGPHSSLPMMLGNFSHGNAHSFLGAAEGLEYMSGWRLHSALKIIDRVKAMLQGERDGVEWQLLEENEWEDAGAQDDAVKNDEVVQQKDGQIITARGAALQDTTIERNEVEVAQLGEGQVEEDGRNKGTSGWTKLKSRGAL